jgi:hypothetical protein
MLDSDYYYFENNSLYMIYRLKLKPNGFLWVIHHDEFDLHRCKHSLMTVAECIRPLQSEHLNRELTKVDSITTLSI